MSAAIACLFGWVALSPVLAPLPPEPQPDPLAKGYLGIWFSTAGVNPSLTIDRVEPNQPAARAGLQGGDVIVRVNHLVPHDTQQVIDHVCAFRPGAIIEVEVRRGDERKAVKIKLGTRPNEIAGTPRNPFPSAPPNE